MNKRGFTLIELLGVIIILSLLIILVLPKITNSVRHYSTKTDELMLNMIESAADFFVGDNVNRFPKENGNVYFVTIKELIEKKYLKDYVEYSGEDITNTKGLIVKYNDGFEYELIDLYNGRCTLGTYIKKIYSETTTTTVNNIEYSLDEVHGLMNDRLGSGEVAKTDGNIRYYGSSPNNYIDIGDRDSEGNIIFWRIIGLFKDVEVTDENGNVTKTEDLVKIIRHDSLTVGDVTGFSWDYKYDGTTTSYSNDWRTSTLRVMLNDEVNGYYGSGITSYYNGSTTATELNFSSTGLSSNVYSKIERVNWSLGGYNTSNVYTDVIYRYERIGTTPWSGKIALMYPSDYGYSADLKECQTTLNSKCTSTNWLHYSTKNQWTLTPYSSNMFIAFYVNLVGYVTNGRVYSTDGVRPVLYLKSNVGIVEEKVTEEGLKYFVVE